MGTIMDLQRSGNHDYVDNKFFSVQEVSVKLFALKNKLRILDLDKGKVTLFVNMTLEQGRSEETKGMLADMNRVLKKYNPEKGPGQFAIYAQFTNDVDGGESRYNKDIASELIKRGLMTPKLESNSIRFMEKVR